MSRMISQPKSELDRLRTPLTPGERRVFEFFDELLPEEWEIYIQPHLNGLRPDFVLLNPQVGIGVFEVKDWDLQAMPYQVRSGDGEAPELWACNRDGVDFRVKDNPVEKVLAYKEKLFRLLMPQLGLDKVADNQKYALVTAGVIFTAAPTRAVQELCQPFKVFHKATPAKYYPVTGSDALAARALNQVFPEAKHATSKLMKPHYADDLRSWLIEPDHAQSQRHPLELEARQQQLATTRTESGFRRIKGPAGSGKSQVLAARAAQLTTEGKEVLVVTYNITLWHYLRDLAVRYPEPGKQIMRNITWTHFHEWAGDICLEAGLRKEYGKLFGGAPRPGEPCAADPDDLPADARRDLFEHRIPELVNAALTRLERAGNLPAYDAVLVDEGQDFNLNWWNLLRRVRKPGGEMLLVADRVQDLYGRARLWTEESMRGAGFAGEWIQLKDCYRLPPALIPYLESFAQQHLPQSGGEIPVPARSLLHDGFPVSLRWIQINSAVSGEQLAVDMLLNLLRCNRDVSGADLTLLLSTHASGLRCVEILKQRNLETAHVFGKTSEERRLMKMAFFMGDARVKAATVHSFKGWESRAIVVLVDKASDESAKRAVYVALTRLKWHPDCSFLTVICRDESLQPYGKSWPVYYECFDNASIPAMKFAGDSPERIELEARDGRGRIA